MSTRDAVHAFIAAWNSHSPEGVREISASAASASWLIRRVSRQWRSNEPNAVALLVPEAPLTADSLRDHPSAAMISEVSE